MRKQARRRLSERSRTWWAALSPEEQQRIVERRTAWYREHMPWRIPLYEQLRAEHPINEPCDRCGGEGRMQLQFDDEAQTVELIRWRCYPCRKEATDD